MRRSQYMYLAWVSCATLGAFTSSCTVNSVPKPDDSEVHTETGAVFPDEASATAYETWMACIGPFYPGGSSSASDLEPLPERPKTLQQLLQNVRLASEKHWLLQPAFFRPEILQKFFSGSTITWRTPRHLVLEHGVFVEGQFNSDVMHGMTVKVGSSCAQSGYNSTSKMAETKADLYGSVEISGGPFAGMTLQAIRDVFGPEDESIIAEAGIDPLGTVHGPEGKGSVTYIDRAKDQSEGGFTIIFTFPFQPSQQSHEVLSRIIDSDVAGGVIVREHATNPLRRQ